MKATLHAVSLAALALLSASGAAAHARPPRLSQVALDPDEPSVLVLTATFGLVTSEDGGASWRWTCAAAYGSDPTREDPRVVLTRGRTLVGTFGGLRRSEDRCDFAAAEGPVEDALVTDLAVDARDPSVVWGLASDGFGPDLVVRSEDGGASFRAVGEGVDAVLLERIALAPSDPSRVYVSGWRPPSGGAPRRAFLYASRDGARTLEPTELALEDGERIPYLVGVDPTDADRVFVRIARGELDDRPERLLASEDGGRSFTSVLELPQLTSFAIAGDGLTVWAGAAGGLWTARGGAMGFTQLSDVAVTCLHTRGPELFVCADPRSAPFALGRSTDGGATIEGLLRIEDVTQLAECPRCSTAGAECPAWVPDLLADYEIWLGAGDAGTATTGLPRDAGVPPECRPPPGCGCRAGARPIELGGLSVTVLLAAARRRRRSA